MSLIILLVAFQSQIVFGEWSIQTYLGERVDLICDSPDVNITSEDRGVWKLPSGYTLVNGTATAGIYLENKKGIDGYSLVISDVTADHRGVYTCVIYGKYDDTPRTFVIRALNLAGPLYHDMFDKYQYNLIRGVIACVALLVVLNGSWATCNCILQRRTTTKKNKKDITPGQTNEAFDKEIKYSTKL